MSNHHITKNFLIYFFIVIIGLGLAFLVPLLANHQGLAAKRGVNEQTYSPEAKRYYVSKTGNSSDPTGGFNTGYHDLQAALFVATSGDEIWVATGVYTVGPGRTFSFNLKPGVKIFGGFDIYDTQFNDRDWKNNVTVLSGDIGGDDTVDVNGVVIHTDDIFNDNAYHVVTADGTSSTPISESTVLDGFTITAGQANGTVFPDDVGGGFYCNGYGSGSHCSPKLSNVTFSANYANTGGAMFNFGINQGNSNPKVYSVTFSSNTANYSGGAIYNAGYEGNSSPDFQDVEFLSNLASNDDGGAVFNDGLSGTSSPTFTNVIFSDNSAEYGIGGAIYNDGQEEGESNPRFTNVTFSKNDAKNGGAMNNDGRSNGNSSPILNYVTFLGNYSRYTGGAMNNDATVNGNSSPILTNVTFSGNESGINGGAMDSFSTGGNGISNPILTNVIFSGNYAEVHGGAMSNTGQDGGECNPILTNVTFSGNAADDEGGAIFNDGGKGLGSIDGTCSPDVRNSIFWNNKDKSGIGTMSANIYNYTATITLTHSLIQGSFPMGSWIGGSYINGGHNIDKNPIFYESVDPDDAPTNSGNLRIAGTSPAIDKGNNEFVSGVPTDIFGEARIKDGNGDGTKIVDMGAYEARGYYQLSVTKAGSGRGVITSSPTGINCGNTCSMFLEEGSKIAMTAKADNGSKFTGWSSACSGDGNCEVTIDADKKVIATFEATNKVSLPVIMR
jgi:predicted outer membrane repeat protein